LLILAVLALHLDAEKTVLVMQVVFQMMLHNVPNVFVLSLAQNTLTFSWHTFVTHNEATLKRLGQQVFTPCSVETL
jgi:hypothetical protein